MNTTANVEMTAEQRATLIAMQRNEATEAMVYAHLAAIEKHEGNAAILQRIAGDEARHGAILEDMLGFSVPPQKWRAALYILVARLFGLSFGLRLMERGESMAADAYGKLAADFPTFQQIAEDEQRHEIALLGMLDDERLSYMGSVVLGLNDALVELTGALAGFTFALSNGRLIAITGLITGLSASMSMAASGYLSAREENDPAKPPLKSALYTGGAYVIAVALLVLPYFLVSSVGLALGLTLTTAFLIIAVFNYYISVARDESFWPRFLEMAALSGGVALISFFIGLLLHHFIPGA